jgi:hypothetical protein
VWVRRGRAAGRGAPHGEAQRERRGDVAAIARGLDLAEQRAVDEAVGGLCGPAHGLDQAGQAGVGDGLLGTRRSPSFVRIRVLIISPSETARLEASSAEEAVVLSSDALSSSEVDDESASSDDEVVAAVAVVVEATVVVVPIEPSKATTPQARTKAASMEATMR